ncbi:hypothetical protein OSB04_005362 [Centaurea solstitialis]|uniref:CCHC-type domain-containing protein n=1 Tax=Centaurea solstitialis TaxID=347529 RepID=A0AA38TYZ7_9ASTR|nr:hypothetical protein OSB04_005362 [Centaurea solstitialis]
MANTVTNTNNLSLRSILEKDKLTGSNFLDWERNLQIVLRHERKWYVLEEPLGEAPPANASTAIRNAYQKRSDDLLDVGCLMLATMSPELQTGLMNTNAYDMIRQLRDMFQTQARTERYDATRALNACKMAKGTSVSAHVMKMKRLLDHLERLGHPVPLQLATDTILNSLSDDYKQFVMNFNMNNMERSIAELHSMLKTAEQSMGTGTKTKDVLMVRDGGVKKKRRQRNTSKGKDQVQVSQSVPKAVDNRKGKGKGKKVKVNKAKAENRCFTCHEVGHWRHNCPKRHETDFRKKSLSTQQLRKVAELTLHISRNLELFQYLQDLGNMSNSYKRCRPKTARIFDRAANIGCDPLKPRISLSLPRNRRQQSSRRKFGFCSGVREFGVVDRLEDPFVRFITGGSSSSNSENHVEMRPKQRPWRMVISRDKDSYRRDDNNDQFIHTLVLPDCLQKKKIISKAISRILDDDDDDIYINYVHTSIHLFYVNW